MKPATMAPIYAGIYPALAEEVRSHGYALAVHGSMGRDLDVVAVPWAEEPCSPDALISALLEKWALRVVGDPNTPRRHGRLCTTLVLGGGEFFLDFSIIPPASDPIEVGNPRVREKLLDRGRRLDAQQRELGQVRRLLRSWRLWATGMLGGCTCGCHPISKDDGKLQEQLERRYGGAVDG